APRLPIAVAGALEPTVLTALSQAYAKGWVEPILVGQESAIRVVAGIEGVDISRFRIVDAADPAKAAVAEVSDGRAQLLMKGQVDTPALMQAVLASDSKMRTGRTIGQVVLMEIAEQE